MATRNSAAAALLGGGKTSSSQPGTFPLGVGGAIAQRIAASRQGEYAFMSPAAQLEFRKNLELSLAELDKTEHEWRLGLVKDKDSKWDKLFELYKAKADIARAAGQQMVMKQGTLVGALGVMGVDPFSAAIVGNDVNSIDGVAQLTKGVGTAMTGLVPKGGFDKAAVREFNKSGDNQAKAQWISQTIGKPIEAFAEQARDYGSRIQVAGGYGRLATTAMVQKQVGNVVTSNISKFLLHAMPDSTVQERLEVQRIFMEKHVSKGNADWGKTDTDAVMNDRTDLDKQVTQKIRSSDYVHEYMKRGGGFDQGTDDAEELERILNLDSDDPTSPMSDVVPPEYMVNKRAVLEAQLARLEWRDPYADQVIRVAELEGFDQYKAALGIKGTSYESNRKAAMILAKDPGAATAAFKFYSQAKLNGVPEAKLDVMYRQYLLESNAPQGGLLGKRFLPNLFGKTFQTESARRAALAGMAPSEVTSVGKTIANYLETGEFQYIKAPTDVRYKEFRDQWIADNAPEGAFVGEDGSLQFVSELLKGQFSNAAASWFSKQKVLDQDPESETFGTLVGETIGPDTLAIMEKDAAYLKSKATALTMSKSTMGTADKTLDFDAKSTATARRGGEIETGDVSAGSDPEKQAAMALFEEMAALYKSDDERQFRRDVYQKELREGASYGEALAKAQAVQFHENIQPLTDAQRLIMEDVSTREADVADETALEKPVTAETVAPVNKGGKKGGNNNNDTTTAFDDSRVTSAVTLMDIPFGGKTVKAKTTLSPSGVTVALHKGKRLMLTNDGFRETTPEEQKRLEQPRSK